MEDTLKKVNNNGFALIEILMVIAIIASLQSPISWSAGSKIPPPPLNVMLIIWLWLSTIFTSPTLTTLTGIVPAQVDFNIFSGFEALKNTKAIGDNLYNIVIQVTDVSGVCLGNRPEWTGHFYTNNKYRS